jgi:hypothetical protein
LTVSQKPPVDQSKRITNFTNNLYDKVLQKKLKDHFERMNWEDFCSQVLVDIKDCYKLIIDKLMRNVT